MNDAPAPREKTGEVDAEGFGAQTTMSLGEAVRPSALAASPDGAPGHLAIGTKLEGVYEVKSLLGTGAMGAVYLVEHTGLGKQFAAKVVGGSRALDAAAVARLRNEARIASSVEHENIVNVTHLGQTGDGTVFIVMEFLRGEDLRGRMARQLAGVAAGGSPWLPDTEVRGVVASVLSGLGAAHAAGVVHRDLKPDNVFLAQVRGAVKPKLVDFGIGKLRAGDASSLRLTETGQIIGTPLYMAPEQTRSTSNVDHRADLYSLGVMIFEMICGKPPFDAGNLFEIVVKHATEPPPDPRSIRPDLPAAVAELILRALSKEPDARFDSADEMLDAWTAAWDAAGAVPPPARPSAPSAAPSSEASEVAGAASPEGARPNSTTPEVASASAPTAPRRPWLLIAAVGAALTGLASLVAMNIGASPATAPVPPAVAVAPSADPPLPAPAPEALPSPPSPEPGTEPGGGEAAPLPEGMDPPVLRRHLIASIPSGAEVVRDGVVLGRTPYELALRADELASVELRLAGHRPSSRTLAPDSEERVEVRLRPRSSESNEEPGFPGLAPR